MRRAPVSRWWNNLSHEPWNHNLHYHRVIVNIIPADCRRPLDIGCGHSALTRDLRGFFQKWLASTGTSAVSPWLDHPGAADIGYVRGDFSAAPIRRGSSDLGKAA